MGLSSSEVIDFSVNSNPLGPSPKVAEALARVDLSRYPDPEATELREALLNHLGVNSNEILAGNGSVELMWLTALAYLGPGDRVMILGPTFGEYERVARIMGAEVRFCTAQAHEGFCQRPDAVAGLIEQAQPKAVFLCNPNNPTGFYLEHGAIENLVSRFPGTLFVVDEAYLAFVHARGRHSKGGRSCVDLIGRGNLLVLRSMTKDYALAGLRLGYAVASEEIIEALKRVQPPWSVNAMAQAAGLAALADQEHLERSLECVWEAKDYLVRELTNLGLAPYPASANFFLVDVDDASFIRSRLLERGCCVRDCASFGLPQFIRIGVRTVPECERLVAAVAAVVKEMVGGED